MAGGGFRLWLALLILVVAGGRPASAQVLFEVAGERALGMGGAFVAVADDATAVHWNPAGLAAAQPAGVTIGWHRFQLGNDNLAPAAGQSRARTSLTSLGTWPLGLSYGGFSHAWIEEGSDGLRGQSLRVSQLGVTVLQSLLPQVVLGSTVKFMRGRLASTGVGEPTAGDAFDRITDLDADARTTVDFDLGLMAMSRLARAAVVVKNLRSPVFRENAENATSLPRQVRAGLSVRPADGVTLAMDVDLNTVDLMGDPRRMFAAGGELGLGSRVKVRSGVRWNLARSGQRVGAVGGSVAVRTGLWLDGHYSRGHGGDGLEFGVALRAGF